MTSTMPGGGVTDDQNKALRALGYVPIEEDTRLWSRALRRVCDAIDDLEAKGEDASDALLKLAAEMEQELASALRLRAERLAAERAEMPGGA